MSRHRAEPPPRYRPRYGRMAVLGVSLTTTAVGLLGGLGVLPSSADDDVPNARLASAEVAVDPAVGTGSVAGPRLPEPDAEPSGRVSTQSESEPQSESQSESESESEKSVDAETVETKAVSAPDVPASSGEGRRVVFSEGEQRVWLVDGDGEAERTYLVSGSLTDNLQPGTYEVYSRSEDAYGIDDSGTMKWFVRFTQGPSGAAIGFHDIPIDEGAKVQTKAQLGTEQSHGCIRQRSKDAKKMWAFAPLGTTVVVV